MKNLLLILFLLLNLKAQSNDGIIKFNAKGHVIQININTGVNVKDLKFDFDNLKDIDKQNKIKARTVLLEKVKEARRIISADRYKKAANLFYKHIWNNDNNDFSDYLLQIEQSLENGQISKILSNKNASFNDLFNKYLADNNISTFYTKINESTNSIEFYQRDLLNSFIIEYVNQLFESTNKDILKKINKENLIQSSYSLLEQKKLFDDQSRDYFKRYKSMSQFNSVFYDSLILLHQKINQEKLEFRKVIKLFNDNFFKELFWLNGGNIKFNPFDITTEKQINDKSVLNLLARPYTDSIFNSPLSPILESRYDSIAKFLNYNDTSIFKTDQLLNNVNLIKESNHYFNFSAHNEIKFKNGSKKLDDSLRVDQNKQLLIHNIPLNHSAVISENEKLFEDKSPFQIGLDSVVAQFGTLGKMYGLFTPHAALIDLLTKKTLVGSNVSIPFSTVLEEVSYNKNIKYKTQRKQTKVLKLKPFKFEYNNGSENFNSFLELALPVKNIYQKTIFDKLFQKQVNFDEVQKNLDEYQALLNEFFSQITYQAINDLRLDSFYLSSVIDIYNKSTAPQLAVNKITEKNALYYSKPLETKPSKKAITKEITVFSFNKKDTSVIQKFTYDVHQYYRVKFSAGIAYTLTPYNQSIATESNGSISVVNDIRLYRFLVGVHYYFLGKGLFNQSNKFLNPLHERLSLYLGVGIPDPLGNVYFGISGDLLPGLKLTTGAHIVKNNKYLIQNNRIIEETLRYQLGGPFIALQIDPASLVNLLNIFKK